MDGPELINGWQSMMIEDAGRWLYWGGPTGEVPARWSEVEHIEVDLGDLTNWRSVDEGPRRKPGRLTN